MRATPLPPALPVATATLLVAVLAPLAVPSAALAERWLRPVPGAVARSFSYARGAPFEAGAHRGVDLAARPGTAVRAACGGRVVHAGPVAGRDSVVSVRCGARRVSHLPLAAVAVRAGGIVRTGTPIGTVAAGHGGLHLGVRRESDPFGYVDPLALLPRVGSPLPIAPGARAPRTARPRPIAAPARPSAQPIAAPARPTARPLPTPRTAAPGPTPLAFAPWPVWAGLALLLSGAAGSGTVIVRRRQRARRAPGTSLTVA